MLGTLLAWINYPVTSSQYKRHCYTSLDTIRGVHIHEFCKTQVQKWQKLWGPFCLFGVEFESRDTCITTSHSCGKQTEPSSSGPSSPFPMAGVIANASTMWHVQFIFVPMVWQWKFGTILANFEKRVWYHSGDCVRSLGILLGPWAINHLLHLILCRSSFQWAKDTMRDKRIKNH